MKILFFAYDGKYGTTYHFVDWILAFEHNDNINIKYLISQKEQNEGLLEKLKNNIVDFDDKFYFIEDIRKDIFNDIDIIHVHGIGQLKLLKQNKIKAKIIFTVHAYRNSKWYKNIFKILFAFYIRKVDRILFLSNLALKDFYKFNFYKFILYKKSYVTFLGVNHKEYGNDDFYQEFTKKYNLSFNDSKKNIVYFAQFHKTKGHKWLIEVISSINREDFIIWLFGEGILREDMIKLTQVLNITNKVKIPGFVDRKYVPSLLSKSYCAISVSKSENGAHNLIEPFASSKALIGTTAGPGDDFLQDYYTGFRIEWKNKEQLSKAINLVLKNEDLVEQMGKNAKHVSEVFFTWDAMVKNCLFIYKELLNETSN